MTHDQQIVRSFWDERAKLGAKAGTQDLIAKELEVRAISRHLRDGLRVLDAGCGNGLLAIELATHFDIEVLGIDLSPEMVREANALLEDRDLRGSVTFEVGNAKDLAAYEDQFDLVYTERVIINLGEWPEQRDAIEGIGRCLRPAGRYLMCENSQNGLDNINRLRERAGLAKIDPPWHNRYLDDDAVAALDGGVLRLVEVEEYSSTYYLLSRVVNAWLAEREGTAPSYDAPVNHLALELPAFGDTAQGKLWVWERTEETS